TFGKRGENLLLGLFAEAAQRPQPAAAYGTLEILERIDLQRLMQGPDALGTEPRQREQGGDRGRQLGMKLVEQRTGSGLADLLDLRCQIGPDAGELWQRLSALQHAGEVTGIVAYGARCIAVCAHAEWVFAEDLEELGDLRENRGDVGIGDGHLAYRCRGPLLDG